MESIENAPPTGAEGVRVLGHRAYVGGLWDEIGQLQFDYLLSRGLQPSNVLLDVACGSLRGGRHFIPYLDRGHYLGLEMEPALVQAGLDKELQRGVVEDKRPEFVFSITFEFDRFSLQPDYAIAQSLLTHLVPDHARLCLTRLRPAVAKNCQFFVTFFEGDSADNPPTSHTHLAFHYSRAEMADFAIDAGWAFEYIGAWGHPRGQVISRLTPR